jgi:hypothetical protein
MRSTEWLPASRLLLTPLRSVWAGVAPRAAIGDRGRSAKNMKKFIQLLIALLALTSLATASDGMKVEVQAYLKEADDGRELWVSTLLINQTEEEKTVLVERKRPVRCPIDFDGLR